jgi:hypothetical protein
MNSGTDKKRFFSLEAANRTLPLVRAIVSDIVDQFRDIVERKERLESVRHLPGRSDRDENSVYGEELRQIEDDLERDVGRLENFIKELTQLGVEFKDPRVGLVDFPAMLDGREVYLCWKLGEDEVGYWHEIDVGFKGRQSVFERCVSGDSLGDDLIDDQPQS